MPTDEPKLIACPTDEAALARAVAATVDILRDGRPDGRGVLIPGGFVLTAAHCLEWHSEMVVTGDDERVTVRAADGREFQLAAYAAEVCQDIAVLGPVDDQSSPERAAAFAAFCADTRPVPLFAGEPEPFEESLAVLLYNRDRTWVPAEAEVFRPGHPALHLVAERQVLRGASGGPVVTPAGELVAVLSTGAGALDPTGDLDAMEPSGVRRGRECYDGGGSRPLAGLPAWVLAQIAEAVANAEVTEDEEHEAA